MHNVMYAFNNSPPWLQQMNELSQAVNEEYIQYPGTGTPIHNHNDYLICQGPCYLDRKTTSSSQTEGPNVVATFLIAKWRHA